MVVSLKTVSRFNYVAIGFMTALAYYDSSAFRFFSLNGASLFQGPTGFMLTCIFAAVAQLEPKAQKKIHQYAMTGFFFSLALTASSSKTPTNVMSFPRVAVPAKTGDILC